MPKPPVMSVDDWMRATDLGTTFVFFHQDRDRLIPIDQHLAALHRVETIAGPFGAMSEINAVLGVCYACKAWLDTKGTKTTDNARQRRTAVQRLLKQATRRARYLRDPNWRAAWDEFDSNKARTKLLEPAPRKELHGHFAREAEKPKGAPRIGATMIGKVLGINSRQADTARLQAAAEAAAHDKSDLGDLTSDEYKALEALLMEWRGFKATNSAGEEILTVKELTYMSKDERLASMLVPRNGRLYGGDGTPLSTRGGPGNLRIYAVDEYGNFYAGHGEGGVLNHSSFNRGKGVLCAGEIQALDGVPRYLSNASGHYKPTTQHLRNAVGRLRDYQIPLDRMWVVDRAADGGTCYESGLDFLQHRPSRRNVAEFGRGHPDLR